MAIVIAAHLDCPVCPECGLDCAVPARTQEPGRWHGPDDATLFCPACGTGWVGSAEDLAQAERAQAAWEAVRVAESMTTRGQA